MSDNKEKKNEEYEKQLQEFMLAADKESFSDKKYFKFN